ncbi:hypothetical protein [Vibrio scophthalmi]|uniref:hypothetical protein n=1 Tax=Vibrio scophthalmi TaxID=45658 RepID=UPI002FF3F549
MKKAMTSPATLTARATLSDKHRATLSGAVLGGIETLYQGQRFLSVLSNDDYVALAAPHVSSSIGEHFRHWLDLFHAIRHAEGQDQATPNSDMNKIDYNVRRRGHPVERDCRVAEREIAQLVDWLCQLPPDVLEARVCVESEVMMSQRQVEEVESTLAREITFAALHATHHFAMAKVVASLRGIEVESGFGLAPATATYQRAQ